MEAEEDQKTVDAPRTPAAGRERMVRPLAGLDPRSNRVDRAPPGAYDADGAIDHARVPLRRLARAWRTDITGAANAPHRATVMQKTRKATVGCLLTALIGFCTLLAVTGLAR